MSSAALYTSNIMKKSSYKNDAFLHNIEKQDNDFNQTPKPDKY